MPTVSLVNGPNLDRLGSRQPEVYGHATLADVVQLVERRAAELGWAVAAFQSNHEGALIDEVHRQADAGAVGLILNAGALSHYSYALYDALTSVTLPAVEVHISDIHARPEEWRHHSVLTPACIAMISGHGIQGYVEALELLHARQGHSLRAAG